MPMGAPQKAVESGNHMEVANSKVVSHVIKTAKNGKKRLEVSLDSGVFTSTLVFGLETAQQRARVAEQLPEELSIDGFGGVVEGPKYGQVEHTVYTRQGQFDSYSSLSKGYEYAKYDSVPRPLSQAGKFSQEDVTWTIDAEHSLVVVAGTTVVRFINTRVINGAPRLNMDVVAKNSTVFDALGVTLDDVIDADGTKHDAKVLVAVKANRDNTKTYLEFGKLG